MEENKRVYLVQINCRVSIDGEKVSISHTMPIFEDIDDAIDALLVNDDGEKTIEDVKADIARCGMAETIWGPTKIGDWIAKYVHVTLTEEVLIKSSKGS